LVCEAQLRLGEQSLHYVTSGGYKVEVAVDVVQVSVRALSLGAERCLRGVVEVGLLLSSKSYARLRYQRGTQLQVLDGLLLSSTQVGVLTAANLGYAGGEGGIGSKCPCISCKYCSARLRP